MRKAALCCMFAFVVSCSTEIGNISKVDTRSVILLDTIVEKQQFHPERQLAESDSCELLAEKIMMSTPVFKAMEADTPHWIIPSLENNTYTFQLYHDFEDHTNTVAWIIIDIKKGEVFQEDIQNDTLLPLAFDKALIAKIGTICVCH